MLTEKQVSEINALTLSKIEASKPNVNWMTLDEAKNNVLKFQSGGSFWVTLDGGLHGRSITASWWTGSQFLGVNNKIITHVATLVSPELPIV